MQDSYERLLSIALCEMTFLTLTAIIFQMPSTSQTLPDTISVSLINEVGQADPLVASTCSSSIILSNVL